MQFRIAATFTDSLFFAGDLGQRIFRAPFSWRALGVDVRGRSHTLRVNYRTSHHIRRQELPDLPPHTAAGGSPAIGDLAVGVPATGGLRITSLDA